MLDSVIVGGLDPSTVGASPARITFDLPGQSKRLIADPIGVEQVMVNGAAIVIDGKPTGHTPAAVLRSGRDTTETNIRDDKGGTP
jgi:hypothetical protein